MFSACPGTQKLKTPTLEIKKCPVCGSEIEIFSTDISVPCDKCGFVAYNKIQSCIQWCQYARECVGDELYDKLMPKKGGENRDETADS